EHIARPHRLEPASLIDARRTEACCGREVVFDQQLHHQTCRVPAARDQAAEGGLFRRDWVSVKRLRVEAPPKSNHFFFLDRDLAELSRSAHRVILEIALFDWGCECLIAHSTSRGIDGESIYLGWKGVYQSGIKHAEEFC